jgi:antitoxin MazE
MKASVAKWGNSLALRIPSAFAQEIRVGEGAAVDMNVENGALVIRPAPARQTYDLDTLLDGISASNRHGEDETGKAVGNEF